MRRFLPGERSEAGETLIEVLLASALMGIVVLAVVGGISTMLLGSKVHRDQTNGNASLVAAVEQLKAPLNTTLSASVAAGATSVVVASATGITASPPSRLFIWDGPRSESSAVSNVVSQTLTVASALNYSHPANVYVTVGACTYTSLPANVTIKSIEYEVNKTDLVTGNPYLDFDASATCDLTSPLTLQRITLQYTSTDSRVTPTLSFIKGAY